MSTWLITGCSAGFGRELVLALLKKQIPVIATARKLESIKDLEAAGAIVYEWDVTSPLDQLKVKAKEIEGKVAGGVSILVNNAGYLEAGTIEETSPEQTFAQFNTNVFGLLNTTRAFLPYMRARKAGQIVNLSSIAGHVAHACGGLYAGTKHAVEALTLSLNAEISPIGLRAYTISPGGFRTKFLSRDVQVFGPIADYHAVTGPMQNLLETHDGKQAGDPIKGARAIIDIVLAEGSAKGKTLGQTVFLGSDAAKMAKKQFDELSASIDEWNDVSASTDWREE
ncbi:NAD-P-binding protein [Meredithblackwellia eburnea MCA 4105]